jgi:hypothetical protein
VMRCARIARERRVERQGECGCERSYTRAAREAPLGRACARGGSVRRGQVRG